MRGRMGWVAVLAGGVVALGAADAHAAARLAWSFAPDSSHAAGSTVSVTVHRVPGRHATADVALLSLWRTGRVRSVEARRRVRGGRVGFRVPATGSRLWAVRVLLRGHRHVRAFRLETPPPPGCTAGPTSVAISPVAPNPAHRGDLVHFTLTNKGLGCLTITPCPPVDRQAADGSWYTDPNDYTAPDGSMLACPAIAMVLGPGQTAPLGWSVPMSAEPGLRRIRPAGGMPDATYVEVVP